MPTFYRLGQQIPQIDPQSWVAPNATLIGDVQLAPHASIWWGCLLRGDLATIRVGEGSNIQDLCVLHTDPGLPLNVGHRVTVGHRVILHGCTIGDGSLIGMGATLLNRVVIGKNCLIGANTLIPEGKIIPDGSLVVGSPGRIVRALSDEEIAKLEQSAARYIENGQRYQRELAAC